MTNMPTENPVNSINQPIEQRGSQHGRTRVLLASLLGGLSVLGYALYEKFHGSEPTGQTAAAPLSTPTPKPTLQEYVGKNVVIDTPTATTEPTTISTPETTKAPTTVPTETVTATPEAIDYKDAEQISTTQRENISEGKFPPLDTWSSQGGEAVFSPGASGLNMLGVKKLEKGDIFASPFPGKIKSVEPIEIQFPKKANLMVMEVELTPDWQMNIFFYPDQKVLKSEGNILSNTPLFEVEDTDSLPMFSQKTILAQVYLEVMEIKTTKPINFTPNDILRNSQNQIVRALPVSK